MNADDLRVMLSEADGPVELRDSRIEGLILEGLEVRVPVSFVDCRVVGVRLRDVTFLKGLVFDNCAFENTVKVSGCRFTEGLSIVSSNLTYTDLRDTTVSGRLDLSLSRFTQLFDMRGCAVDSLDLRDAIILETFNMDSATVSEGVFLDGSTVNGSFIESMTDEWPAARRMLVENNGRTGLEVMRTILEREMKYGQSDDMLVARKRKEREGLGGARGLLSDLSYAMGGYGMRPQYTLAFMALVVLVFAVVFDVLESSYGSMDQGMGWLDGLFTSMDSFFTIGRADIPDSLPVAKSVGLLEGIVGVFLMFYFTVLLTRKIIR